jgi:hypothetical protein
MSESGTTESPATSTQSCTRFILRREGNHENSEDNDGQDPRLDHDDKVLAHEQTSELPDCVSRSQREGDDPEVLDPDHPLMKRFQAALKKHLERQYSRFSEEVLELVSLIAISRVLSESLIVRVPTQTSQRSIPK